MAGHYASRDDIDELYGPELLIRLTDTTKSGVANDDIIDKGLRSADDIINAYVSERFTLPLPVIPGVLRECAVDIAVYKIALSTTKRSTEMTQRYADAIALLERIGAGKAGLGLTSDQTSGDTSFDNAPSRVGRSINTFRVG